MPLESLNLYQLERTESFSRSPAGDDIRDVVRKFAADPAGLPEIIEKSNRRSTVFSVPAGSGRLIVKSVALSLAATLEAQCAVANRIPSGLIRPLVSSDGSFVVSEGRNAWMAYLAVEGEIYDGRNLPATSAITSGLDLLSELRALGRPEGIPSCQYRPERWAGCMAILTDPDSARSSLADSGCHLSAFTLDMLWRHGEPLRELAGRLAGLAAKLDPALVHNDLQHANVVVTGDGPVFLDLEDICMDAPQVAAAHAAFKLFRHAVFCGATSPDRVRQEFPSFREKLEKHAAWSGARVGLPDYMALRVISDISEILLAWLDAHDASDLYDLEKRLHNLLEVMDLFGETSPWI